MTVPPDNRLVHLHWRPHELSIGRPDVGVLVREPPEMAIAPDGKILAVGTETSEAVAQLPGSVHVRLDSAASVLADPLRAFHLLLFLRTSAFATRDGTISTREQWRQIGGLIIPQVRDWWIVHFDGGAERGIQPSVASALERDARALTLRAVFLWSGEPLRDSDVRSPRPGTGRWIGKEPRWAASPLVG